MTQHTTTRALVAFALATLCLPAAATTAAETTWQRYQAELHRHPALAHLYSFVFELPPGSVPSTVPLPERLEDKSRAPVQFDAGPLPGTLCIALDDGTLQGAAPTWDKRGFTVEIRFRKRGPGSQLGNGRTNGMLIAVGNGYWDGWRLWTDYPNRQLHFEIGRRQPSHAVGLTTPLALPDYTWIHAAASWDGRQMRVYINGLLAAAGTFDGDLVPASVLRIGYANAGIGSLKWDVAEVALYNAPLDPHEIAAHALLETSLSKSLVARWDAINQAVEAKQFDEAQRLIGGFQEVPQGALPNGLRQFAAALVAQQQGRNDEAFRQFSHLAADSSAVPMLRHFALRQCIPRQSPPIAGLVPVELYRELLQQPGLSDPERTSILVALAATELETSPARAREYLEEALQSEELSDLQRADLRLQHAHTYYPEDNGEAARAAYAELARDESLPGPIRGLAALAYAQTWARQGDYAKAAAAFGHVAERSEMPDHLRLEGRERQLEMQRLAAGQPARDPAANRVKLPQLPKPGLELYVAPSGDDNAPGTKERPLASLAGARDAIRRRRAARGQLPQGGVTVWVRDGRYQISDTIQWNEDDSGTEDAPIVFRAWPGESPVFTGGVRLTQWTKVTDQRLLARLPSAARPHVLTIDLKDQGIHDYGAIVQRGYGFSGYPGRPWVDLYVNGRPQQLARWPNEDEPLLSVGNVLRGKFGSAEANQPGEFEFDNARPSSWKSDNDLWMFGAWGHLWAGSMVQVAGLDREHHRVSTVQASRYGFRQGQPFYFLNVLDELDRPGEWYLDRDTGRVLFFPDKPNVTSVEFPILDQPFLSMQNVRHLWLVGLTFETGRAEGGVIRDGEHVTLAGCVFRRLGTNGLVVQGGRHHRVVGCDIGWVGAGGIRMAGGDRQRLEPGGHVVENCHIHDFSRIDRVYAPAVHLDGVGNRIAHNLFHESPHHALRVEGYDHTIEYNEIHSVVYEFDDQAGIDMYGNPTYRGNVIRFNYWHHIGSGYQVAGQAGVRLDDYISAVRVYGNVFYRCSGGRFGGVQIHGGKDNIVDNNLFVDCKYAVSFSPWGERRWRERLAQWKQRSGDAPWAALVARYPDLDDLEANADRNFLWRNLTINCQTFAARDRGVNQWFDNHAWQQPKDVMDRDETRLPLDIPTIERGPIPMRPIPFDDIGLYADEYRATWPVRHSVTRYYVPE